MAKGIVTETIRPPRPPRVPSASIPQRSATGPHGRLPIPAGSSFGVTPKPPDASWWRKQYGADPEYLMLDPTLRAGQNQIAQSTGFVINRDASGNTLYKTASGVGNITQQTGANGEIVYKDAAGNVYKPSDLQMDIRILKPGESGYLSGQLGLSAAESANRQQTIAETGARAGVRRSGMTAATSIGENEALKNTINTLTTGAMSQLAGIDRQYAQMLSNIYNRLVPAARDLAEAAKPTVTTPKPNPVSPSRVLSRPTSVRVGKSRVVFPKGIDLSKVDVDLLGQRVASGVQKAGGRSKLKDGNVVASFASGGSRYRVVFVKGRFVVRGVR